MKKWPILAAIVCGLALCGILVSSWLTVYAPTVAEPSGPAQTAASAVTAEPTAESTAEPTEEPTTAPTEPPYPVYEAPDETQLHCRHAFVYDLTNRRLLYTYGDQNESISPASLTKLATCCVAMQYLDPETVITVGEEAGFIAPDSSIAAIRRGNRLTVGRILQGTMMQSGNDGAYVLAVAAGRAIAGDPKLEARAALDVFMTRVNYWLQSNGLTGTHFVTPDGYDAEGHHITAANLLQLARLALNEPLIAQVAALEKEAVTYESGEEYTWVNTNWLLRKEDYPELYCPEATGLKTGGTRKAGNCVIATFDDGDRQLMIGVLGCEIINDRFVDARFLFDHFRNPAE